MVRQLAEMLKGQGQSHGTAGNVDYQATMTDNQVLS